MQTQQTTTHPASPSTLLSSWRRGPTRTALIELVRAVTSEGSPDYVAPSDRVATFDNDGTLWVESPLYVEGYFLLDRVAAMAAEDPALASDPAFAAVLARDHEALRALGKRAIVELVMRTHACMSTEEFERVARDWFAQARHPQLGRLFRECVYQPMCELMDYLRSSSFAVYIVSGGGIDFVRAISEDVYGVPRANVIGSACRYELVDEGTRSHLEKRPELDTFDDREAKAANIHLHVGRRPQLAFGNSDGDLGMLAYATGAEGRRAAFLLHHDDADREFAYDGDFLLSPLVRGLDMARERGWTVASMRHDFARVFSGP